ncbi:uncharacterized protein LOC106662062 [Cimex lectularius]|uniref:Osiris n=1 Tax=Cimex lectularius TaxID=79782 RepID=A0A8I6RCQ2_CIMLE|nr:uncharacterized protein LOC106662062 [Cimex lectularius]
MLRFAILLCLLGLGSSEEPLRLVRRVFDECFHSEDAASCFQGKAVALVDRAARADFIPFGDSFSFVRTAGSGREGKALSDNEVEEAGKQGKLQDLLWDRIARFFNTHTVMVNLPKLSADQLKTGMEEGRGKMKKMMGMMMMGGAMKAMAIIPLALGTLFLLAGKALIIAKVALVLSLIITLKKLLNSKQDDHGWQSSGGHGGGGGWDRRSLRLAQDLAYNAYKQ